MFAARAQQNKAWALLLSCIHALFSHSLVPHDHDSPETWWIIFQTFLRLCFILPQLQLLVFLLLWFFFSFFYQRRIFTYLLELRQTLFPHGRYKTRVTPPFDSVSEFVYVLSAVKMLGSFPWWEKCPVQQQRSPTMTHTLSGTRPVLATKSPVCSPNTLPNG